MSHDNSYRQILRSSSIIGGASVINVAIGLLRTKAVAVFLGPAGVGLIGLLQNLLSTATAVCGMGVGTVGTRQVAEASCRGDETEIVEARRALFWGTLILALVGSLLFWLLRDQLAARVLGDVEMAHEVGWLALGVGLTVGSASQNALLNGLRRIRDIALLTVGSAIAASIAGVACIAVWGEGGILAFVLVGPLSSFLLGLGLAARIPRAKKRPPASLGRLVHQWGQMVRLGVAFVAAGVVVSLAQLAVRAMVQQQLGPSELGQFQAAWTISMTYIGFVLAAMGTDYYPRLSAVIDAPDAANRIIREQTEAALLMAGPVFLAMLALAPWVIRVLYSQEFAGAVPILRWQILGDLLKVSSWPLGFALLAAGDARRFVLTESLAMSVFVAATWFGLPLIGISATGVAFAIMYVAYVPVVYSFARRRTGFGWSRQIAHQFTALMLASVAVCALASCSETTATVVGLAFSIAFGLYSIARLGHMAELEGPIGRAAGFGRLLLQKMGIWRD